MNPETAAESIQSATTLAAPTSSTFEWGRIQSNTDWLAPGIVFFLIAAFAVSLYRRDGAELRRPVAFLLVTLRVIAFLGLLFVFLKPQWRNEHKRVDNSTVIVMCDTSLSMQLADDAPESAAAVQTRTEGMIAALEQSDLVQKLRTRHDVVAMNFDQSARTFATLKMLPSVQSSSSAADGNNIATGRMLLAWAGGCLAAAVMIAILAAWLSTRKSTWSGFAAAAAAITLLAAMSFGGVLLGKYSRAELRAIVGGAPLESQSVTADQQAPATADEKIDWAKNLTAMGLETRLGEALGAALAERRIETVSGVLLFTDGQQNSGLDPQSVLPNFQSAKIAIHPVGLGSEKRPVEVWIADFQAPHRAYPGDRYTVVGYLRSAGLSGRAVTVSLTSRDAAAPKGSGVEKTEGTQQVTLGDDNEPTTVKFELTPDAVGARTLKFRVNGPTAGADGRLQQSEARVEIIDRKTRVLLFAGGPAREYQFLRNMLKRDKNVVVDVLLQSSQSGASQDANKMLDEFPSSPDELFEYDAIVAFDPDWRLLTAPQIDLLERWVAEQSGGLIAIAGPLQTDPMAQDPRLAKIRGLFPVEFNKRLAVLRDSRFDNPEAWPIEFTRDGQDAEFLWLGSTAAESRDAWTSFPGVFGYYSVRGAKPGATVYGRFSDPRAGSGAEQPPYLAGQIYGSGRVFYLGSGEMWRLRQIDDAHFETFYTKLLRFVSQGRLLRGSKRGVLLVERDTYSLGNTVAVQARLNDEQLKPLDAPRVELTVTAPDATNQTIELLPDATRAGNFRGQFTVRQEGTWRLIIPETGSQEELATTFRVRLPDLENENRQRNDQLLNELATASGGVYYKGISELLAPPSGKPAIESALPDRKEVTTELDLPEPLWNNRTVLYILCGALCLEWLIRRLARLA